VEFMKDPTGLILTAIRYEYKPRLGLGRFLVELHENVPNTFRYGSFP
jgi:hypothetical protein